MTKTINKGKKDKKKFKIQKPLEGRRLPKLFNPDGSLNEFYKKSAGGVTEGIKNIKAKGMKEGDTVVVDGERIPVIKPQSEFIKRKPTKKEMQEDRAKNRPSRNITGDRAKQRKRKKLVRDTITASMIGAGLGRKFGVKNPFMQQQQPLGKVGKKTGDMILSPKADLDGDGMFSEYEKKRGMAIQKAMAENSKPVKVAQASQGGGIAIRGTKFKGVF
jgi:hypothetical protein|tara:strand:+ start:177 stop:827 length:651 start_codon:yes stop_codon:yes gene_type:complete